MTRMIFPMVSVIVVTANDVVKMLTDKVFCPRVETAIIFIVLMIHVYIAHARVNH